MKDALERPYKEYRDILETEYDISQLTPMQVDCFCNSMHKLEQQLISNRDKFAMEFAEWIGSDQCPYEIEGAKTDAEIVKGYLDLFKQSLKTDNK